MTYFKWAERQADTTINWAEVGKNMSDMLQEEARLREAKKSAIDEASRQFGEQLSNSPMGEFEPANQFSLEFAGAAQEMRLIQDNLLRAGMLKPKDYAILRQNLNDGTNTMFDLAKAYQDEYEIKLARIDNPDPKQRSQAIEAYLMERFEGLSNLTNTKAVINPTNNQVSLGRLVEKTINGETVRVLSDDEADVFTVNELNGRIKQKFNYFDVDSYMSNQVQQLGDVKTMMVAAAKGGGQMNVVYTTIDAKQGNYITDAELAQLDAKIAAAKTDGERENAKLEKERAIAANSYLQAEKNMIESIMTSPLDVSSILTENMMIDGKPYSVTMSKKEYEEARARGDESVVFFEKNVKTGLSPVFTEAQEEAVYDYLKIDFRKRISTSEEAKNAGIKPYYHATPGDRAQTAKTSALSLWNKAMTAKTNEQRRAAFQAVLNTDVAKANGVTSIDIDPETKKLIYVIEGQRVEKDYDPENVTLQMHAELGTPIHSISDPDKMKKYMDKGADFMWKAHKDVSYEDMSVGYEDPTLSAVQDFQTKVDATADVAGLKNLGTDAGLNTAIIEEEGGVKKEVIFKTGKKGEQITVYKSSGTTLTADELKNTLQQQAPYQSGFIKKKADIEEAESKGAGGAKKSGGEVRGG